TSGDGNIKLHAGNDIKIDYLDAGATGRVELSAGGSIYENGTGDAATDIVAQDLIASARGRIARATTALNLETAVATLDADATAGDIAINELDGINLVNDITTTGTIRVTAEGSIGVQANLNAGVSLALNSTGGAVNVTAGKRIVTPIL